MNAIHAHVIEVGFEAALISRTRPSVVPVAVRAPLAGVYDPQTRTIDNDAERVYPEYTDVYGDLVEG